MLLFTVFQRGDKYTAGSDQLPAVQSSRRVVEHDDIMALRGTREGRDSHEGMLFHRAQGSSKGRSGAADRESRALILQLIQEGFTEFRVGGAVGFDMIMAELLLRLRTYNLAGGEGK